MSRERVVVGETGVFCCHAAMNEKEEREKEKEASLHSI